MSFGKISASPKVRQGPTATFGVAVLGDFSGRANRGELEKGAALATRKPRRVDIDNLDSVLESMNLRLCLPVGDDGGAVEVNISSVDDFHPDQLYEKVEVFAELAGLRSRLKNSKSFDAAAAEVRSWGSSESSTDRARDKPRGSAIPNAKLSDFAKLMGRTTASESGTAADELIKQIVGPYIKPAQSPDQAELLSIVDGALTALMRRILHHPDFQTLESLWRSVDLLVRELETDGNLQVILYDISAEEIAADLSSSDSLEATGLYQLLVEQPALDLRTTPPSVIVGNYGFEQTPPHAELLGRIAKIAAAAQAPFVAAIGNEAFEKKKPEEIHPLVAESWASLRALPHSAYLGLVVPRFMLRWPYGAKTEPIDPFEFEEFSPQFGLKGFLWGNGAILAGLLLGKTFSEQGIKGMKPGSIMIQGDLPIYYFTDSDGDQIALPCTERLASEAAAAHILTQNFMPVLWMRGRPEVRLGSFKAVSGASLAGPWAPLEMPADTGVSPAAAAPQAVAAPALVEDVPTSAEEPREQEPEAPPATSQSIADLDALLGELDVSGAEAASEPNAPAADTDNDLDALLASIEGDGESDNESNDDEMDPDLAALLAAL